MTKPPARGLFHLSLKSSPVRAYGFTPCEHPAHLGVTMANIVNGTPEEFEKSIFQNLPDARDNRNNWLMVTAAVLLGKKSAK